MLGAHVTWTVHRPALITVPELCTGTYELSVRLYAVECWLTNAGVAWTLLGGWGGLYPSGG